MLSDVEIITQDIPGWVVTNEADLTVALDTTITDSLRQEGISRELVNRIQNIWKEQNFDVTDNIIVEIQQCELLCQAVDTFKEYICSETLTKELQNILRPKLSIKTLTLNLFLKDNHVGNFIFLLLLWLSLAHRVVAESLFPPSGPLPPCRWTPQCCVSADPLSVWAQARDRPTECCRQGCNHRRWGAQAPSRIIRHICVCRRQWKPGRT